MKTKAILFDMDGVLVDSEPIYHRAERALFASWGVPFTDEDIQMLTGSSGVVAGRKITQKYPAVPVDAQQAGQAYDGALLDALRNAPDLARIHDVTLWLYTFAQTGLRMAIGSSSTREMVDIVVRALALAPDMETVVTGSDVPETKPSPAIYLEAARRLGLAPEECVVIEDSPSGIASAHRAGMLCAAFTGTNRNGLDQSAADFHFAAFDEDSLLRFLMWLP